MSRSFDVEAIRAHFPALSVQDQGRSRIYLDNPAGTQVPDTVIERMGDCLLHSNANLGGSFVTSVAADAVVDEAHAAMADLLGAASPREIVFGQNMTSLTFHVSRSIGLRLQAGDEIVLSRMDHDANVTPWRLLARDLGLGIRWLEFDREAYEFPPDALRAVLGPRTRLVCFGYSSNVLGTINPVSELAAAARAAGALVFVDAVHSAPHAPIDVAALGCDFLACSAYKFFGPHQGILWGREEVLRDLEPYRVRPAPSEPPGAFETGTQSHEGMAGVTAAVDYLAWVGRTQGGDASPDGALGERRRDLRAAMDAIREYETGLAAELISGLNSIRGLTVHGISATNSLERRVPTVSFTSAKHSPASLERRLAAENVFVWSGHSYAVEPLGALGLLESGGVLRVGLAHYNTQAEVQRLLEILDGIH